jgi:bifunctional DNase/RNase
MIDGPVSSICIIDRESRTYPNTMYINPGDIEMRPSDSCGRFALDRDFPK